MFTWASRLARRCLAGISTYLTAKWLAVKRLPFFHHLRTPSPEVIIAKVADTYGQCDSYLDSGCVTTHFFSSEGVLTRIEERPFSTAFVRPDRFRFQLTFRLHPQSQWHQCIIAADKEDVRVWSDLRSVVERPESLARALAGATGISGGSAHTIPCLLMPDRLPGRRITELRDLKNFQDGIVQGVQCYRIQGHFLLDPSDSERYAIETKRLTGEEPEQAMHGPLLLWIEKETYLIRRLDMEKRFTTFRTEVTTTYEARIGIRIEEDKLRFGND